MSKGSMCRTIARVLPLLNLQGIDIENRLAYGYYIDTIGKRRFKKYELHFSRHNGEPRLRKQQTIREELYYDELSGVQRKFNLPYREFIQRFSKAPKHTGDI